MRPFPIVAVLTLSLAACESMSHQEQVRQAEHTWTGQLRRARLLPANPVEPAAAIGDVRVVDAATSGAGYADMGRSLGRLKVEGNVGRHPVTVPSHVFAFATGTGGGVPTRALPVAAGLTGMQSGRATWTLHAPMAEEFSPAALRGALEEWEAGHRRELAGLAPTNGHAFKLRIVTRVVGANQATLVVRADEPWAGKRWDGYDNAVAQVLDPVSSPADVEYRLDALNATVAKNLGVAADDPGGVAVVSASSQVMTLAERLPETFTVGYVAWDVPIGADGRLLHGEAAVAATEPPVKFFGLAE